MNLTLGEVAIKKACVYNVCKQENERGKILRDKHFSSKTTDVRIDYIESKLDETINSFKESIKETEARIKADREESAARLAADREEFVRRFDEERKEWRSHKRWLYLNFGGLIALIITVVLALINGNIPVSN